MRETERVQSDGPQRGRRRRGEGTSAGDAPAGPGAGAEGHGEAPLQDDVGPLPPASLPPGRAAARRLAAGPTASTARAAPARGAAAAARPGEGQGAALETRNEVVLVGRVAAPAEERTLPSGDLIATWRLVVDRPPGRRTVPEGVRAATVDTLDCVAWGAGARRTARGLAAGDVVAVEGALRRRFWRAGPGAVSRCEIEVATVKRLSRAPAAARRG